MVETAAVEQAAEVVGRGRMRELDNEPIEPFLQPPDQHRGDDQRADRQEPAEPPLGWTVGEGDYRRVYRGEKGDLGNRSGPAEEIGGEQHDPEVVEGVTAGEHVREDDGAGDHQHSERERYMQHPPGQRPQDQQQCGDRQRRNADPGDTGDIDRRAVGQEQRSQPKRAARGIEKGERDARDLTITLLAPPRALFSAREAMRCLRSFHFNLHRHKPDGSPP
ncbi:MAG: hypothetical protein ACR2OC_12150 [Solirubrobacterales bacterium]